MIVIKGNLNGTFFFDGGKIWKNDADQSCQNELKFCELSWDAKSTFQDLSHLTNLKSPNSLNNFTVLSKCYTLPVVVMQLPYSREF